MEEKPRTEPAPDGQEGSYSSLIKPQARQPYDPTVAFEEYHYYANKTREEELGLAAPHSNVRKLFQKAAQTDAQDDIPATTLTEADFRNPERRLQITDEEWTNASRAFRSASAGACELDSRLRLGGLSSVLTICTGFFLITTDVLGPYGSGYTMGTLGWGPGVISFW
jgi:uncharacterized protein (DUF2342 family)